MLSMKSTVAVNTKEPTTSVLLCSPAAKFMTESQKNNDSNLSDLLDSEDKDK